MEKKYKLTDETIRCFGQTLHRIEALKDFGDVKKGDKGGWIKKESNLQHKYNCWVYEEAKIYDNAQILGDAKVYGSAEVHGSANVFGEAEVFEKADIFGESKIYGEAQIHGNASIYDNAEIFGKTNIFGDAQIFDEAKVYGKAKIYGVCVVCDEAEICGNARVYGVANICEEAIIKSDEDYIVFKNFWSSGRYFTYTKSNKKWKVGCFHGTGKELIQKAYKDSEVSGKNYERFVKFVENLEKELENDLNDK